MKKSINVYWTTDLDRMAAAANQKSPQPVTLSEWEEEPFMYCPSLRDYCKNVFSVNSRIDFNPLIYSPNQEFFLKEEEEEFGCYYPEKYPGSGKIRNTYSMEYLLYLVTDEPSLDIEITQPFLSNTSFSNSCEIIPGAFNLGKYSRSISLSFQVRSLNATEIQIKEGDALYYIRFKTDKKINFIPFYPEKEIMDVFNNMNNSSKLKSGSLLKHYENYKRFNTKKVLLDKIRGQLNEG